jgi:hypothetical protein
MSDDNISIDQINLAMIPLSRKWGFCLCIHPFMGMIDISGMTCKWCLHPITEASVEPSAKIIRSKGIRDAYPTKPWKKVTLWR